MLASFGPHMAHDLGGGGWRGEGEERRGEREEDA